jgi:hypothetical protein
MNLVELRRTTGFQSNPERRESHNMEEPEEDREDYPNEIFNFACILRGNVKDIEALNEYIVNAYLLPGTLKPIKPVYDKQRSYIITAHQWEEYQTLKNL